MKQNETNLREKREKGEKGETNNVANVTTIYDVLIFRKTDTYSHLNI